MAQHNDLPLEKLKELFDEFSAHGVTCYMKFSCAKCGARQAFEETQTIYTSGTCENCGHLTKIAKGGFMCHAMNAEAGQWLIKRLMKGN